jgi:hypothetical protein
MSVCRILIHIPHNILITAISLTKCTEMKSQGHILGLFAIMQLQLMVVRQTFIIYFLQRGNTINRLHFVLTQAKLISIQVIKYIYDRVDGIFPKCPLSFGTYLGIVTAQLNLNMSWSLTL